MYPIKHEEYIKHYTQKYEVDPFLVLAIAQVETKFNHGKISKKGAIGMMQIMPETARWIVEEGGFPDSYLTKLDQKEVNIELSSWYLAKMYHQFNRNAVATIAAYNAGPGNVSKWISEGKWDGSFEHANMIPFGETRHYVQRVFYFYDRFKTIYRDDF